jgi:SAM-dependent methyltransferase
VASNPEVPDVGLGANAERFSGFADLYDSVRPTPPTELATMVCAYAGMRSPGLVVDLGSGTGLSTRWAATWADDVIGVEPSADMRVRAAAVTEEANVRYAEGWSSGTGLPDRCADVVVAVQALHWMDPAPTFAEIARVLRPGGVFAALDCDWPPSIGSAAAEAAWGRCRGRVAVYEERLRAGLTGDELRQPLEGAAPSLPEWFSRDPNKGRATMAAGVRSWSKDAHLARMRDSGVFGWCTEVAALGAEPGGGARFVDLLRSQGDLQTLLKEGVDEELIGVPDLAAVVQAAVGDAPRTLWFTWRARLGVTPTEGER